MKNTALITGATSGIGKACAVQMANEFKKIIITGRRKEKLENIKKKLSSESSCEIVIASFDVSKKSDCLQFFENNKEHLNGLEVLINNAGLAIGTDPIDKAEMDDWDQMIDTNVKGLFYMTRLCLPYILQNKEKHIVNISSVSGQWVYPGGGVYCSTKHAVSAFSQGLRMDLNGQGVRVTNICPGMVETEFSNVRLGDDAKADQVYANMTPLTANDIAGSVQWALNQPQHVNIQEMTIFPTDQASISLVHRSQ